MRFFTEAKIRIKKICAIYAPPLKVKKNNFSGMNIFYFLLDITIINIQMT